MRNFSLSDKAFDRVNYTFMLIIVAIITYPLIYIASASISNPNAVATGEMWLWPVDITFEGFKKVFENAAIWRGYRNTIFYTALGTTIHLIVLLPCAYALSRKDLMGKKFFVWFILFTMLFNGGLIPTYLVVQSLGMLNTPWAIVIPNVVGAWSILVAYSFFKSTIPDELVEASQIDGASNFSIFFKIVLPLSGPIIAVMGLFHGVSLWNQYFNALIYLTNESLYPLQLVLREILVVSQMTADMAGDQGGIGAQSLLQAVRNAELVKYAVMIISTLPLLLVYPFLQRFFVKGVLIGSVKE